MLIACSSLSLGALTGPVRGTGWAGHTRPTQPAAYHVVAVTECRSGTRRDRGRSEAPDPAVIRVRPPRPGEPSGRKRGRDDRGRHWPPGQPTQIQRAPGQLISDVPIDRIRRRQGVHLHLQLGIQAEPQRLNGLEQPVVRRPIDQTCTTPTPQQCPRTPTRPAPTPSIHRMSGQQRIQRRSRSAPDRGNPGPGRHLSPGSATQRITQPAKAGLMRTRR
jgi:hypothetical protein